MMAEKKILDYFDYDQVIGINIGARNMTFLGYDLKREKFYSIPNHEEFACLYKVNPGSYDDYEFISSGNKAVDDLHKSDENEVFYIDKLRDKIEHLYAVEPNIKKPLQQAKDRLYQKAIIQYFQNWDRIVSKRLKYIYVMTCPSNWTLDQVSYLRSLVEMAGVVYEHDHPNRLVIYRNGEAIIRYIQKPLASDTNIVWGQNYMIYDLSGSKVEMYLYNIKPPLHPQDDIKYVDHYQWYNGTIKDLIQLDIDEMFSQQIESHVSSLFYTPSIKKIVQELMEKDEFKDSRAIFTKWWAEIQKSIFEKLLEFTTWVSIVNRPMEFNVPHLIQYFCHKRLNSSEEPLPQWITDRCIKVYPRELKEKIFNPACDRIVEYLKKIIETVTHTIDGVIFACSNNCYLTELVVGQYEKATKHRILPFSARLGKISGNSVLGPEKILEGAINMCQNKIATDDAIYKPRIILDDHNFYTHPGLDKTQKTYVFIDYGFEKTRISYIDVQSGEIVDSANIKYIMEWPGQSVPNRDFPTLNTMIFPKTDSSQNSCKIFSLQELTGHNEQLLTCTNAEYYTFEKDEYSIILVTHRKPIEADRKNDSEIEDLEVITAATILNSSLYEEYNNNDIIVNRKRISVLEFSFLYFKYLAEFLKTHIYSKTGIEKDKYRYCITRDSQAHPEWFTLTDENIHQIAVKSNLILAYTPTNLLILERTEASAIYCRRKMDTSVINNTETHLYFLQVQLFPDRCLLVLNIVPLVDDQDSLPQESVHKYAKTKNTKINMMDIISENLWVHTQKNQKTLLERCKNHQSQQKIFNSKKMQMFKKMFQDYFSNTQTLDLQDSEKMHKLHICSNSQESCCRVHITNLDILEFGITPAIDQLFSIVQNNISSQTLFQGVNISDIFVMGEFIDCQDFVSYKFLEELLIVKMEKIHFLRLDNLILQSMAKKTRVTKLNGREYQQEQAGDNTQDGHDSLTQISSSGSVTFGIDPKNRLVERLAGKSYFIYINRNCITPDIDELHTGELHQIIMLNGIMPYSISSFTVAQPEFKIFPPYVDLLISDNDDLSLCSNQSIDEDNWKEKYEDSNYKNFEIYIAFSTSMFFNRTYPLIFNARFSQTESHKFWIDHREPIPVSDAITSYVRGPIYVREPILLRSCHIKK